MKRKVFFSFHYGNDVSRAMVVRNSHITRANDLSGFIDKAEFEKIKNSSHSAICNWIDTQLHGTTVTVVLIGQETLNRPYIQYEIMESLKRGNKLIAVKIGSIRDLNGDITPSQSIDKVVGRDENDIPINFSKIISASYDYILDDGYNNINSWINQIF